MYFPTKSQWSWDLDEKKNVPGYWQLYNVHIQWFHHIFWVKRRPTGRKVWFSLEFFFLKLHFLLVTNFAFICFDTKNPFFLVKNQESSVKESFEWAIPDSRLNIIFSVKTYENKVEYFKEVNFKIFSFRPKILITLVYLCL